MPDSHVQSPAETERPLRFRLDPTILSRISRLDLRAKYLVQGLMAGLHKSRERGFSSEFSEYRNHVPGEPLGFIDWKVFGRTEKLFVREYHAETALQATFLVDMSASMGASPSITLPDALLSGKEARQLRRELRHEQKSGDVLSKKDYAVALAASLAWLLVNQGDRVGLMTFSDRIMIDLPPRSRRNHAFRIMTELARHPTRGVTRLDTGLYLALKQLKKRGMVILISDFMGDLDGVKRRLAEFRYRGQDLIVFCVMDHLELHPALLAGRRIRDPETGKERILDVEPYRKRIKTHLKRISDMCRSAEVPLTVASNRTPFDHVLIRFLSSRRIS